MLNTFSNPLFRDEFETLLVSLDDKFSSQKIVLPSF
uniref:Uncharacterized protein n=1 Tax=Arundo donax TaxID=35708 RepID=A0A0A9CJQ2_ARUDO